MPSINSWPDCTAGLFYPSYRCRMRQNAFTLVELVMTIVIIGILSASAIPKFFDYTAYQQKAFFDDTLNAIRYAQKLAVATACNVQVAITANQFTIKRPGATDRSQCASTNAAQFTQTVARPGSGGAYQGSLSGVTLSTVTFYFTAKGNASGSFTLNVGSQQISVVQDTGFVYAP